uniref:Uncharacterized protein n=1 Tax=Physcomitrium patens TaxID=3218 RepID=A0A2K1ID26_PHYPA|nr:hypothetical protein PHYPA_030661 [Physcomitrium patens]
MRLLRRSIYVVKGRCAPNNSLILSIFRFILYIYANTHPLICGIIYLKMIVFKQAADHHISSLKWSIADGGNLKSFCHS